METSKSDIRQFEASDGYRLHYRYWRPQAEPRGYVVALHGIQSHSGWYEYTGGRLCSAGYDVRFLDRRGSGLNETDRGHVSHYERLINDVAQVLADVRFQANQSGIRGKQPGCSEQPCCSGAVPVILLGVSWGGKLAAAVAALRPELIDGVSLLYPGICTRIRPRWYQQLLLCLAMGTGKSGKMIPVPLDDPAMFTDEPEWQEYIRHDPLSLHRVSVSFLWASCELDRLAAVAPAGISCPVLLMLAARDRIIDNAATKRYFEWFDPANRTLIEYPEARHTLEFEPNRAAIVDDLLTWMHAIPITTRHV